MVREWLQHAFVLSLQVIDHLALYSLCPLLACQAYCQLYNSNVVELHEVIVYAVVLLTQSLESLFNDCFYALFL